VDELMETLKFDKHVFRPPQTPEHEGWDLYARATKPRATNRKEPRVTETAIVESPAAGAPGDLPTLDFTVRGMTCGSCANRVQRTLGKQPGVASAEVNFATATARVVLAERARTSRRMSRR